MRKLTRTGVGPHFGEAARLLWIELFTRGWSQSFAAQSLGIARGFFSRILYGDQKAGRELALRIEARLGIAPALWDAPPREPFVLPAVAQEEAARLRLAAGEAARAMAR